MASFKDRFIQLGFKVDLVFQIRAVSKYSRASFGCARLSSWIVYMNDEKTGVMVGWAFGSLGQLRATVYFLNSLNLSSQYAMVSKTLENFVRVSARKQFLSRNTPSNKLNHTDNLLYGVRVDKMVRSRQNVGGG